MNLKFKLPGRQGPGDTLVAGQVQSVAADRVQRMIRWTREYGRWILAVIGMFIAFVWLTLPTDAIAWRISHEAKKRGYVIDVEDVSISPFGGIALENFRWTFQPSRPGQVPSAFLAEEVEVDISLIKLMFGTTDVEVEVEIDEGTIYANYIKREDDSEFVLEIEDVPVYALPKARQAFNAPLKGMVNAEGEVAIPDNKFGKARGSIQISCMDCGVGDGETLLYVPGSKGLLARGVTIPEIDLGSIKGKLVFEDGVAEFEEPITTKSDDIQAELAGRIRLKDPFKRSRFDLVLKVDISEGLQEKSESIRLMVQTAHKSTKLDPPEQGLGFRLRGPLERPKFTGIKTKSRQQRIQERRKRARRRAQLRQERREARERRKKRREEEKKKQEEKQEQEQEGASEEDNDDGEEDKPELDIEPLDPVVKLDKADQQGGAEEAEQAEDTSGEAQEADDDDGKGEEAGETGEDEATDAE